MSQRSRRTARSSTRRLRRPAGPSRAWYGAAWSLDGSRGWSSNGLQVRPPVAFPPDSRRAEIIEDAEADLEQDMEEVKDAVHAYNVDFQRRIVRLCDGTTQP